MDWNKSLAFLFTLNVEIPDYVFKQTLTAYEIPAAMKSQALSLLGQIRNNRFSASMTEEYKKVIKNQPFLNKLGSTVNNRIKNDLKASNSLANDTEYKKWEKKTLDASHVEKIANNLNDMKTVFEQFYASFLDQLYEAHVAKEAFIHESGLIPNTIINEREKTNQLSVSIFNYKQSQINVYDHLEKAWNISCDYRKQRDTWVDFLIGTITSLD